MIQQFSDENPSQSQVIQINGNSMKNTFLNQRFDP